MKILSEDDFRAAVRSEVRRCTRYAHFFSVVSVDLTAPDLSSDVTHLAAEAMASAVRNTDVVGRPMESLLAVILHHAEESNTQAIMQRIRGELATDPDLAHALSALGDSAFRQTVFPSTARDAATMLRQLGLPERGGDGDDDEDAGPAPVGARI